MRKFLFVLITLPIVAFSQPLKIGKLKYDGGGDWYANKTALPNLIKFCNENGYLNNQIFPQGTPWPLTISWLVFS